MIGIDLGGTNIRAAFTQPDGTILASRRIATRIELGVPSLVDRLEKLCRTLATDCGLNFSAIGIGLPGILHRDGSIRVSPNLPELADVHLAKLLQERIGVPVYAVNDADAIAWGESRFGATRNMKTSLTITLGTGIGGGLILNRALWSGACDGISGEIGHLTVEPEGRLCGCGNRGCLETYASATGIVRSVKEALPNNPTSTLANLNDAELTAQAIAKAARNGDTVASAAFELAAGKLGQALAGAVNLLNPDGIVICGGLSNSFALMKTIVEHELHRRSFVHAWRKIPLLRGSLGDNAGILGAADLAGRALGFSTSSPRGTAGAKTSDKPLSRGSKKPHMTIRQEELDARELYRMIMFHSPEAIFDEVEDILSTHLDPVDINLIRQSYGTAVQLYRGEWPGYQPCNTEYHDLFHATHTFLSLSRFIHGSYLEDFRFPSRSVALALATAIFHDAGYLQEAGDTGSGAKYTREHVRRGIDLFRSLAPDWGVTEEELHISERLFLATDLAIPYSEIDFGDETYRQLGLLLDAADLITQMSDRAYLEKLLFLYHEFTEAGLNLYSNESEMLKKTFDFYAMIEERLKGIQVTVDSRVKAHFLFRNGMAVNPYYESMRRQKDYLAHIISQPGGEPVAHLKRDGIVEKVRQRYHS